MKINIGMSIIEFDYDRYCGQLRGSFFDGVLNFPSEIINLPEITGMAFSLREWQLFVNYISPDFQYIDEYDLDEIIRVSKLLDILCITHKHKNDIRQKGINEIESLLKKKYSEKKKALFMERYVETDLDTVKRDIGKYHFALFFNGISLDIVDKIRYHLLHHVRGFDDMSGDVYYPCDYDAGGTVWNNVRKMDIKKYDKLCENMIIFSCQDCVYMQTICDFIISIHDIVEKHKDCKFLTGSYYGPNECSMRKDKIDISGIEILDQIKQSPELSSEKMMALNKIAKCALEYGSLLEIKGNFGYEIFHIDDGYVDSNDVYPLDVCLNLIAIKREIIEKEYEGINKIGSLII